MPHRLAQSRFAFARAALVVTTALAVAACASAAPLPTSTPLPTINSTTPRSVGGDEPTPTVTEEPSAEIPDEPTTTSAVALTRPQRGSGAPIGAVVFGADVAPGAQKVNVTGERTTFSAGRPIAWRVTLPDATGGESVRVTLTTQDNTETQVDEFVAQAGWNVYYGKSLLTVAAGTYVLHYLIDGHEVGSGTFKIKGPDAQVPGPSAFATDTTTDAVPTLTLTPTPTPTATLERSQHRRRRRRLSTRPPCRHRSLVPRDSGGS